MSLLNNSSLYSSPHRHKKKYYNYPHEKFHGMFLNSLKMFFLSLKQRFATVIHKNQWVAESSLNSMPVPYLIWIGHSTFLIQFDDISLITDPIFGNASPLFKRIFPPGIPLKNLMPIDYVLLSHNHRDHMDYHSLRHIRSFDPTVLVPEGDKRWLHKFGFKKCHEMTWWQSISYEHKGNPLTFTFLPAHHWSQRTLFDRNRSLWGSWMISYKDTTIYFAGDSAYAEHFSMIGNQFKTIDIALMPIGPCEPRKWMDAAHLSAQQAGQAFIDLGARHFIPMHWGTFYFGIDSLDLPLIYLKQWWQSQQSLSFNNLFIPKIGEQVPLSLFVPEKEVMLHKVHSYPHKDAV